jgi:hypothetical protein
VLEHVGQCLLDDAVHRQLDAARQWPWLSDDLKVDGQAARAVLGDQRVELGDRWLRS